jgi:antitoxin component YwqK of YwqJK toxin-antitoxin module
MSSGMHFELRGRGRVFRVESVMEMMRRIFKVGKKKPKNGRWKEFNKHAVLVAEGMHNDGLKHGIWRYYYDTGEPAIEETYVNGRMHGTYTSYHLNGSMMSEGQYENDCREGPFNIYNEQGELLKVMHFVNNILMSENYSSSELSTERETT